MDKNIYQRMHAVMQDIGYVQKGEKTVNGQYRFVSHDAVTAKVREALIKHGIVTAVSVEKHSQDGNRTEALVAVRFVNIDKPEDCYTVHALGYGIDPQDKGPGKAISYAVKYAYLKAFALETGDDPERDSIDHKPGSDGVIERIKAANVTAKDAAGEAYRAYNEEHREIIDGVADEVVALVRGDDLAGAAARCHEFCGDDLESQLALSYRLPSDVANKLKKHKAQERERARIDAVKRVPLASQA